MEKKYLKAIAVAAVVLTLMMLVYTLQAVFTQTSSSNLQKNNINQTPTVQTSAQSQRPAHDTKLFPDTLNKMNLSTSLSGQEAITSVSKLHGTNISIQTAYVVEYRGKGSEIMTIWYSETNTIEDAQKLFKAMDDKMPKNQSFQNYKSVTIDSKDYKFVTGMQQEHYYWRSGKRVLWIAVGGINSLEMLKEVIPLY